MNKSTRIQIGDWVAIPALNLLEREGSSVKLEPRAMDLLVCLANAHHRVVSADELLRDVWQGRVFDDGAVYKKINQLRKALGESSGDARYIETIPKRGYRLVADVIELPDADDFGVRGTARAEPSAADTAKAGSRSRLGRRSLALGFMAGMLLVLGLVALVVLRVPERESALRFTPLSLEHGGALDVPFSPNASPGSLSVVWSPDGRALAFSAREQSWAPPQLFVRYFDSPVATQLTRQSEGAFPKQWTSSGRLVFAAATRSASASLWSISPVGGTPELFLEDPDLDSRTATSAVSRDGTTVAMLRSDEEGLIGIWLASMPGGTLERYEPAPFASPIFANVPVLAFSPDDRQLLLMWNPVDGHGIQTWLLPLPADDANPPRRVLPTLPMVGVTPQFSWMPDNRHIVVSTSEDGRQKQLYVADTVSGAYRELSGGTTSQSFPSVSPDGSRLAFVEIIDNLDIVTVELATGTPGSVVATDRIEQMPAWAEGAPMLAYVSVRSGEPEIWVRDQSGLDRPLVMTSAFDPGTTQWFMGPALSPDASRIIYGRVERNSSALRLWMSAVSGGPPVRLTRSEEFEHPGSWSPDGDWYVYPGQKGGMIELMKVKTTGQAEPEPLAPIARRTSFGVPVWSPAGDWILYDNEGLKLVSPDGITTRDLGVEGAVCTFARVEEVLYCVLARDEQGRHPFVVLNFDGHVERVIGSLAADEAPAADLAPALRLTLTPDDSGVTYSVAKGATHLWLVDGLADVPLP